MKGLKRLRAARRARLLAYPVGALFASFGVSLCGAEEPASPPVDAPSKLDARFDELLTQLGSDSFIQRDWAARQMAQRGPAVIPPLVNTIRETEGTAAAAAIRLLLRLSRGSDAEMAAPALQGVVSLREHSDSLPPATRELLIAAYEDVVRSSLAHLMALGARIDRDNDGRAVRIIVQSERFTNRHLRLLAPLTTIRHADFRGAAITDPGLERLASLTHLEYLNLSDTHVTGAGFRHLQPLTELTQLIVYRLPLSEEDFAWVRENLPQCQLSPSAAERRPSGR